MGPPAPPAVIVHGVVPPVPDGVEGGVGEVATLELPPPQLTPATTATASAVTSVPARRGVNLKQALTETLMRQTIRLFLLGASVSAASIASAQGAAPATGKDVLAKMRSTYAGAWYKTLTFRQTTTIRRPDGKDTVQTWYETLRYTPERGTQLRIDVAPLESGNASISTWDSTWVVRVDTLAAVRAGGNPFLALIEGAYMQPVTESIRQLAPLGFNLDKLRTADWNGTPVWVVGTTDATDSTSAQFWVEDKHLMVVRIILANPGRAPLDIHLGALEKCGKGWLATRVEMFQGGARRQAEDYHDWKCDVPIDAGLFTPGAKGVKHWAR